MYCNGYRFLKPISTDGTSSNIIENGKCRVYTLKPLVIVLNVFGQTIFTHIKPIKTRRGCRNYYVLREQYLFFSLATRFVIIFYCICELRDYLLLLFFIRNTPVKQTLYHGCCFGRTLLYKIFCVFFFFSFPPPRWNSSYNARS